MQCCGVTCLYLYSMKHGPPFETTVSFIPETEIIYSRFSCVIGDSDLIFINYLAIDWDEISSAWSICLLPQGFSICFIIKNPFMVLQVQGAPRSADPQFDNTQTDSWSTIWFYVRSSIARKLMSDGWGPDKLSRLEIESEQFKYFVVNLLVAQNKSGSFCFVF